MNRIGFSLEMQVEVGVEVEVELEGEVGVVADLESKFSLVLITA